MTANTRSYYRHIALAAVGILLVVAGFLLFQGRTAEGLCSKGVHHLQEAISSLEEEVLAFSADSSHILRILEQPSIREQFLEEQGKRPYSILIYQDGELAAWSSNEVVPANVKRIFKDRFSFTKLSNGYYEVIRTDHAGD